MTEAIVAEGLGKRFARYQADGPHTFKEALVRGLRRKQSLEHFWALKEVSLSLAPGEMVGVIGHNGAGKSTLLQLLGGVLPPDEGRVRRRGRLGGLLDLGAGFHPDLTGRENAFINGIITGLTRREVARRFEAMVGFAELEHAIDAPLRTYSSGMKMRLGFAVAAHTDPDILLIDEVLTVGDLAFQRKCLERIERIRAGGCAIVLISHDLEQIRRSCEKTLWLREGRQVAYGESAVVVGQYTAEMSAATRARTPSAPDRLLENGTLLRVNENRFGSLAMEITGVRLLGADGSVRDELERGEALSVEIRYLAPEPVEAPIFSVTISSDERQDHFDVSSDAEGLNLPRLHGAGKLSLHFDRLDLNAGCYYVDVGVYERNWAYAYDYHWHVYPFTVHGTRKNNGTLSPPRHWELDVLMPEDVALNRQVEPAPPRIYSEAE